MYLSKSRLVFSWYSKRNGLLPAELQNVSSDNSDVVSRVILALDGTDWKEMKGYLTLKNKIQQRVVVLGDISPH